MKEHQDRIMKRTKNMDLSTLINRPVKAFFDSRIEPSDIAPSDGKDKIIPTTFRLPADIRNYYKLMANTSRTTLQGAVLQVLGSVMEAHTIYQKAECDAQELSDCFFYNTTRPVDTSALFHEIAIRPSWYFSFIAPLGCGKTFAAKEVITNAIAEDWQVGIFDIIHDDYQELSCHRLSISKETYVLDPEIKALIDLLRRAVFFPLESEIAELLNSIRKMSEPLDETNSNSECKKLIVIDGISLLPRGVPFLNTFYLLWLIALRHHGIKLLMLNRLYQGEEEEHAFLPYIDTEIFRFWKKSQKPKWQIFRN